MSQNQVRETQKAMLTKRPFLHQAILALGGFMLILSATACHKKPVDAAAQAKPAPVAEKKVDTQKPMDITYRITPGDTVEITYFIRPRTPGKDYVYRFDVGDELVVEFLYDKNSNFQRMVRPDGRISVPVVGDVMVVGETPEWLAEKVKSAFSTVLQNPMCSINVVKVGRKEDELKEAITTNQGRQKDLMVRPDGFITFPIINDVYAAGKTLPELYAEINRLYRKEYANLETSVQLKGVSSVGVYVAGEVARPGNYPVFKPTTPLQALALAGGVLQTANLKKVIVITRDENRKPVRRVVNVAKMLKTGELDSDVLVGYDSVIYVPKTAVAVGDQFVEQYINKLLMFQGYSLGFTYLLNQEDNNNGGTTVVNSPAP